MKHTQIISIIESVSIKMINSKYSFVTLNCAGIYPVAFAINEPTPWGYKEAINRAAEINTVHHIKEVIKSQI